MRIHIISYIFKQISNKIKVYCIQNSPIQTNSQKFTIFTSWSPCVFEGCRLCVICAVILNKIKLYFVTIFIYISNQTYFWNYKINISIKASKLSLKKYKIKQNTRSYALTLYFLVQVQFCSKHRQFYFIYENYNLHQNVAKKL